MHSTKAISLIALFFISGCAIAEKRTEILIFSSGYEIDGEVYNSRPSLATALIASKVRKIQFISEPGVAYKQVEAALDAAREAGITDIGLVGSMKEN